MKTVSVPIRVVLFDLGGVLVELSGVPALLRGATTKIFLPLILRRAPQDRFYADEH